MLMILELKRPLRPRNEVCSAHSRRLSEGLQPGEVCVHTDGPASPNPGPCGYGLFYTSAEGKLIRQAAIGIGSSYTGEVCAIREALRILKTRGLIRKSGDIFRLSSSSSIQRRTSACNVALSSHDRDTAETTRNS